MYKITLQLKNGSLTLFAVGLKIYVIGATSIVKIGEVRLSDEIGKTPKITVKNQKILFCFSDRSYRNRKSHEIWGYSEAFLRVLELILR